MSKKVRLVFTLIFLVLLIVIVADHAYDWACYGVCYGCELYCGADELSECCAECSVAGQKFTCCFPDDCWIELP